MVEPDVTILKGGPNSKDVSGAPRRSCSVENLLHVTARLLSSYSEDGDVTRLEEILTFEKHSLKCSYGIALVLRHLENGSIDTLNENILREKKG